MKVVCISVALLFWLSGTAEARAQGASDHLARIRESLKEKITKEMPGWTCRSIDPITGSEKVIIQHCEVGEVAVKVAITLYPTEGKAAESFENFRTQLIMEEQARRSNPGRQVHRIKEELPTLGNGGFVWDVRGAQAVSFRKGATLVHVSIARPEHSNDVFFSRRFAQHVASLALQ